jgi:transcription elongation factor/antiterminator RfaH
MQKKWYALYTKSRNEKKTALLMERQGIEFYLPLIKKISLWSDRKKIVEFPLFPSYIFVHAGERETSTCAKIPGVVRFVSFEKKPVPIPDFQIEAIRKFILSGEDPVSNDIEFTVGKKVRVIRGGLKGLEGRLAEVLGRQRVRIEIDVIRQSLFLQIPLNNLEIIGEEQQEEVRYW